MQPISPQEVLELLSSGSVPAALIDVRSPGEFGKACVPGFLNLPILTDRERHEVGITYKREGQESAIALGHRLVAHDRDRRIAEWLQAARSSPSGEAWVTCWRGGLRSKTAVEWVRAEGLRARTIAGGYKGLRTRLLTALAPESLPKLRVLTGNTGSGKTRLLREVARSGTGCPCLDLEALARHRGSSFGALDGEAQPAQASFENALAVALLQRDGNTVLVEDESARIGTVALPLSFRGAIARAELVVLEVPIDQRVQNVLSEYVLAPLESGADPHGLCQRLGEGIKRVHRKLGDQEASRLLSLLREAFQLKEPHSPEATEAHSRWIEPLLTRYYDPLYEYSRKRHAREIAFRGGYAECLEYLRGGRG